MYFELNAIYSLSIAIGAIIGWVRWKKTDPAFSPFLWLLWLGLSNEIISLSIMNAGFSNAINYNLFCLAEFLLISLQFKRWELFKDSNKLFWALQFLFVGFWIVETMARWNVKGFDSYFIIGHAVVIVLMSIHMLNKVMFMEPTALLKNPIFLICIGLVIFFTYSILVEAFWVYGLTKSKEFRIMIYEILAYINLFTNLVFALAALWIPMKRQYILQS